MNCVKAFLICVLPLSLHACSSSYYLAKPPNIYSNAAPYSALNIAPTHQSSISEILYVTDRQPAYASEATQAPYISFGHQRSPIMRYGTARVEIGKNKNWDEIILAANSDIRRVKMKESVRSLDPKDEFPLTPLLFTVDTGVVTMESAQDKAFAQARERFQRFVRAALSTANKKEVIIYIHGFNTSFEEAVFTTNDLYHYSGRAAVPIAYSWPAGASNILGYFRDQASADYTIYHLKTFLRSLMEMREIDRIHIVAHSLGTVATSTALRELLIETRAAGRNPLQTFNIENLILAAPDIDYGVVTQRLIAEQFGAGFGRITVYTNPKDKALSLSGLLQASLRFGKLLPEEEGVQEKQIFDKIKNVSFITVRGATPGLSNHGYFMKDPSALSDIITLINTPSDPGTVTRPMSNQGGNFWAIDETYLKARGDTKPGAD